MVKMQSERPLLVGNEARTEFETSEQHAKELEAAGLAVRAAVMQEQADPELLADPEAEPQPADKSAKAKK